jgi:hypothetical protein
MVGKIRVVQLIEYVIQTRKWVIALTRNLVKSTVINAESNEPSTLRTKSISEPDSLWLGRIKLASTSSSSCQFFAARSACEGRLRLWRFIGPLDSIG